MSVAKSKFLDHALKKWAVPVVWLCKAVQVWAYFGCMCQVQMCQVSDALHEHFKCRVHDIER